MMNVGLFTGLACVTALLAASIVLALLGRKEKTKGSPEKTRFLSRMALVLFLTAFIGGVIVTLLSGVRPREAGKTVGEKMAGAESQTDFSPLVGDAIGTIDQKEFEDLQDKVKENQSDVKSRERLGHLYLQMQDFENVFRLSHEALQVDPRSAESRVHMGMVLHAMGETESALTQFDQVLEADPKNTEALLFKGIVQSQAQQE